MITNKQADRLKNNPFYTPSKEQQEQIDEAVPEYGILPKHDTSFEKHPTGQKRKKRSSKNNI